MIEARMDDGGLKAAFDASMQTPCIAEKLAGTSFEDFRERISSMRVMSFYDQEKPIGAAAFHGHIGHIGILPEYHGRWANRRVLTAIGNEWGSGPVAIVDKRNPKALRFVSRLGLRPMLQEGKMVTFA